MVIESHAPLGRRDALPEPLWREVLGHRFRVRRLLQNKTLVETAARAGISPQYLSEIERGLKEASSEMIAAVAGALGMTLVNLTEQASDDLRRRDVETLKESRRNSVIIPRGRVDLGLAAAPVALALAA